MGTRFLVDLVHICPVLNRWNVQKNDFSIVWGGGGKHFAHGTFFKKKRGGGSSATPYLPISTGKRSLSPPPPSPLSKVVTVAAKDQKLAFRYRL